MSGKPWKRAPDEEELDDSGDGQHPSFEHLAAYHSRAIALDQAERIQEHLVACRACAEIVLELEDFASIDGEPTSNNEGLPDDRPPTLTQQGDGRRGKRHDEALPAAPTRRAKLLRWALAASVLMGVLCIWLARTWPGVLPNPLLLEVPAAVRSAGPEGGTPEAEIPPDTRRIVLIWSTQVDLSPTRRYRLEISTRGGAHVLTLPDLWLRDSGYLSAEIPVHRLPTGTYRFELYGDRSEPLEIRHLRLVPG